MLPATMTVGPFLVNAAGLREHLLSKTSALVAGCFDLLGTSFSLRSSNYPFRFLFSEFLRTIAVKIVRKIDKETKNEG